MFIRQIAFILLLLNSFLGISQNLHKDRPYIDSLLKVSITSSDPLVFIDLCKVYRDNDVDSSIIFAEKAIVLSKSNKESYNEAMSYAALAASYRYVEDGFDKTIKNFEKAGDIFRSIGDKEKEGRIYNNVGMEYDFAGDYSTALQFYIKSLKLYEEIDFKLGQSEASNNIGLMYELLDDLENAKKYYQFSIDMSLEIGDSLGWSMSIANLAAYYDHIEDFDKSIELYNKAIEIRRVIGEEATLTQVYNNLGALYYENGDTLKALELMEQTLKLNIAKNAYKSIATNNFNIGFIYHDLKNYNKALYHYNEALTIAQEYHYYDQEKEYQGALSNVYADIGDFENGFNALLRYIEINDSLFNEEKERVGLQLKEEFESEKKDITIAKQDADIKTELAINSRKQLMLYLSGGIIIIVIGFSFVLFSRIRKIREQKKEIEKQKKEEYLQKIELQEKNKEITDSIQYAKRIQAAILPPAKLVKEYLQESFILYKPKDIVAGDFYWMEQKSDKVFFAAADCTGHGVPGAMVSVVCHNAMNRSVREFNLQTPASILNKTREIVIQEFEKSDEDVKDGMDIALCALEGKKLEYAGANNPLWIVRENEIMEIKADKQPIGKFEHAKPFTNHVIDLQIGDSVYIFSDGYVDQFGGERGKKFKSRAFRELLLSIQSKTMLEQKNIMDETFEKWRGEIEQIDDVCVIGLKV